MVIFDRFLEKIITPDIEEAIEDVEELIENIDEQQIIDFLIEEGLKKFLEGMKGD